MYMMLAWKQDPASPFYDHILIRDLIRDMTTCRQTNDMAGLLKILKLIYARHNIGKDDVSCSCWYSCYHIDIAFNIALCFSSHL